MTDRTPIIVCGIDDSPNARAALEEAVRLAARRGGRVRALLVYEPPEMWGAWAYGPTAGIPLPRLEMYHQSERHAALEIVDPVLDGLRDELVPLPEIEVDAIAGRPVEALVEAAEGADALVVGHRGLGAVESVMVGSTSLGCVLHATCPVTVVPAPVPV
ncbi:universal stress protein [Actinomycetospora endophytica]|uniref:Universal stress protein n=1 Tax=Actinomycetospora endophytica TaxID=2291215 RepID=A0ABS8PB75_9PSEU|nr:universal stress protein [Actinomycetospora endophytica]MCD2195268.1 universal stress protein [Actinomycetospora endophytica]